MRDRKQDRGVTWRAARVTRMGAALCAALSMALIGNAATTVGGASAATYTVAQCGWRIGHEGAWFDSSGQKFQGATQCIAPAGADPVGSAFTQVESRPGQGTVSGTRFARWRWQAPAGTAIVAVRGQRWRQLSDGMEHRLGYASAREGFVPFSSLSGTDLTKRDFSKSFQPPTSAFESRLLCARPQDRHCSLSPKSLAGLRALIFTLDDPSPPIAGADLGRPEGAWLKGDQAVHFLASDSGSGIRGMEIYVDSTAVALMPAPCNMAQVQGVTRGAALRPCGTAFGGKPGFSTTALSDGNHNYRACAIDFAGNRGCSQPRGFRVDNGAPAAPTGLAVIGGDGWRRENGFGVEWTNPSQGTASPIAGAVWRLFDPDGRQIGERRVPGKGIARLEGIQLPRSGEHRLRVWLYDEAGNEAAGSFASVALRLDREAPTGYLLDPDEGDPELFRASVEDEYSGVARGRFQYRMLAGGSAEDAGAGPWVEMEPSVPEPGEAGKARLAARLDTDSLAPGHYQFRVVVADGAGNVAVIDERANGSPMVLELPVKRDSVLETEVSSAGRAGADLSVPFGAGTVLSGRLQVAPGAKRGAGEPIQGERVTVTVEPAPGSDAPPRTVQAGTDRDGRFSVPLEPGPSLTVSARYGGSRLFSPSAGRPHRIDVAGAVGLDVRPRRTRTGKPIRLSGSIAASGALASVAGQTVAIQYFERAARAWRPVLVRPVDGAGRFSARYRFRYLSTKSRISMRAVLLPSPGYPYASTASQPVTVVVRPKRPKVKKLVRKRRPARR